MVKWLTAFSMEELTRSISAGKEEALKDIPILAQMNTTDIDEVLAEASAEKQTRIHSIESKMITSGVKLNR